MNQDFSPNPDTLHIPREVYRPIRRCPSCHSVYITDKICESCGRSMTYHPIGEPFGVKSAYGIKERYLESLPVFVKFYPQFESKNSREAKSYIRNISKRFTDLIAGFNELSAISQEERKLFYIESMEIINELLRFDVKPQLIEALLEQNDNSLIGQELLYYLHSAKAELKAEPSWWIQFENYRLWGVLRLDFFLKACLTSATVIGVAVGFKELISSQFGR